MLSLPSPQPYPFTSPLSSSSAAPSLEQQLASPFFTDVSTSTMLVPSPSSSCRIRWVLNLSLTPAHSAHDVSSGHPLSDSLQQQQQQRPQYVLPTSTTTSSSEQGDLMGDLCGDPVLGGRLDGLSDEPDEGNGGGDAQYRVEYGGFDGDLWLGSMTWARSEQKLRWRVELQSPNVVSD